MLSSRALLSQRSKPTLPLLRTDSDGERKGNRYSLRPRLKFLVVSLVAFVFFLALFRRPLLVDMAAIKPSPDISNALLQLDELQAEVSRLQSDANQTSAPYLLLAIPTVPRTGATYLRRTLDSIDAQLSKDPASPMFGAVRVLVVNNGGSHSDFEKCREHFEGRPDNAFLFVLNTRSDQSYDPKGPNANDRGTADLPGYLVRRQTRDIANLLNEAKDRASYFMFMEDDFLLCPLALLAIQRFIEKVGNHQS
jgi:hypothetical protein